MSDDANFNGQLVEREGTQGARSSIESLVRLIEREEAAPAIPAIFDLGEAHHGKVLNSWRALANRLEIFYVYIPYVRAVIGQGPLDRRLKEFVQVQTVLLNRCRSVVSHRVISEKAAGISEAELEGFSDRERLALVYAPALKPAAVSFADEPTAVDPELVTPLRAQFSDAIVELTATIALWKALARLHPVLGLQLYMEPSPAEIDHVL